MSAAVPPALYAIHSVPAALCRVSAMHAIKHAVATSATQEVPPNFVCRARVRALPHGLELDCDVSIRGAVRVLTRPGWRGCCCFRQQYTAMQHFLFPISLCHSGARIPALNIFEMLVYCEGTAHLIITFTCLEDLLIAASACQN